MRSLPSASSSREAAAFRSASGGSVTGADASARSSIVLVLRPPRLARLRRGAVGRVPARRAHCFSGQQWLPFWLFAQPGAPGDRPHKAASGA